MKSVLLFVSLIATPVCAQEGASILDSYGAVSSQHLITAFNANLTPSQRAQLDQAVAKRNAALAQNNAELVSTLRGVLGETDEGLKNRMMSAEEVRRMEAMRRAQPARYLHLMNKKKKQLKKQ
ncbi:hypothetical protein EON83_21875 [bacterium]|nr:MAG: hypothetical protein EON83_21875 [bacterium]